MVKITYKPFEEVIILEYNQFSLDTLASLHGSPILTGNIVPPLRWAEGVVFIPEPMPPEEFTLYEMKEHNRLYLINVSFAEMLEYKPTITTNDRSITVNVLDVTSNPILKEVAKWLKTRLSK